MRLILTNNLTKVEVNLEVNDLGSTANFYHFEIALPTGLLDGEYSYRLYDNSKLVANGLIQIGEYERNIVEYNDKKKIVVYNG